MKREVLILCDDAKYDWVRFFARHIKQELLQRGMDVLLVDLRDRDAIEKLNRVNNITEEPIFVLTFEGEGFLIPSIITGMNWIDLLKNRVYTYFSRHPQYYREQLDAAKSWNISLMFTDKNAVEYISRYHTQYEGVNTVFPPVFLGENSDKAWAERQIDVLVPATYVKREIYLSRMEELPETFQNIGRQLRDKIAVSPEIPMEQHLIGLFHTLGVALEREETADLMQMYGVLYEYLQTEFLEKVVRNLLRIGLEVTVCGSGWEEFKLSAEEKKQLHRIGGENGVSFQRLLDVMGDSKMVVQNQMKRPFGVTLRLMCAMANGAAVLTDRNPLLTELFGEDKLFFYENRELDQVCDIAAELWRDESKIRSAAEAGKLMARNMGDVQKFVQSMLP